MNDKLIIIKEHHTSDNKLDAQQIELLREILDSDDYNPDNPDRLLGIDWNNRARTDIKAKYYIGLKWIKEGNLAVYVHPKINNLDYMSMLMHCFNNDCKDVAGKLGKIYNIDLDRKPIKSESNIFELTPILIAHFLKLTQNIVQGGYLSFCFNMFFFVFVVCLVFQYYCIFWFDLVFGF